jgi:hypothetical protein
MPVYNPQTTGLTVSHAITTFLERALLWQGRMPLSSPQGTVCHPVPLPSCWKGNIAAEPCHSQRGPNLSGPFTCVPSSILGPWRFTYRNNGQELRSWQTLYLQTNLLKWKAKALSYRPSNIQVTFLKIHVRTLRGQGAQGALLSWDGRYRNASTCPSCSVPPSGCRYP